jgi:glycine/D-amino acid oxidase-like deaminating enzyme
MLVYDAVVVGAGIFGSVLTRALRKAGLSVLVLDAACANAGSAPAACLMRPSWFSSLGKDVYNPALKQLDDLIGIQEITFKVPAGRVNVHWCDPRKVLLPSEEITWGRVLGIFPEGPLWEVRLLSKDESKTQGVLAKRVIVAIGIWTETLVPEIKVAAQAGVAWLWSNASISEPFIKAWAPYKQIVAFNRGDGLWVGDGTSIKNWSKKYEGASLARCEHALSGKPLSEPKKLFGYRPYVKEPGPCMFKQVRKNVWVATGGAKNGTLAAGWCADQLLKAI